MMDVILIHDGICNAEARVLWKRMTCLLSLVNIFDSLLCDLYLIYTNVWNMQIRLILRNITWSEMKTSKSRNMLSLSMIPSINISTYLTTDRKNKDLYQLWNPAAELSM